MAQDSPLRKLQEQAEAEFLYHGRPVSLSTGAGGIEPAGAARTGSPFGVEIVATYGELEAEYAAIRKAAGLMERPQRGTLVFTGADRVEFLNRMLTNELKGLSAGQAVQAFWLNRKGRIEADLALIELGDRTVADLDVTTAAATLESLNRFIISENVAIADAGEAHHGLSLHGPRSLEFLRAVCDDGVAARLADLTPGRALTVKIQGHDVIVERRDTAGEIGLELLCPTAGVLAVHEQILEAGLGRGLRSIGWLAYNIARVEAGTPLYLVDFGPDSLPHETGILRQRVSFTKGCYLGQEIVARMESLGHPSKMLVGLCIDGEAMPVTGAQVFMPEDALGEVVGAVTSATLSPMLGRSVVAFAMVKHAKARPGETLLVNAEGKRVRATVHGLRFWPKT